MPAGWHGQWPGDVQTVAERSGFTRTVSSIQLLEFISALKGKSENIHVVNMFVSPMRKVAPAIVLSNPRVTSAQQARTSGKPVMFLFGNIHPPEPEAAEALMMVARDLAMGARKNLLDNQIVIIAPIFNVDGTDTFETQDGSLGSETPYIQGTRENAAGLDLNRDAVKLQTVEAMGMYRLLNDWDPVLLLDGHLMSRVSHGYANTYGTTTVPAAAPGPRDYTHDTLFPAVRDMVRRGVRPRGLHTRAAGARTVPAHGLEPRRRCLDRRGQVHRQRLRAAQSARDHHRDAGPADVRAPHLRPIRLHHGAARVHERAREGHAGGRQEGRRRDGRQRAGQGGVRPAAELAGWRVPLARQDRSARVSHERAGYRAGTSILGTRPGTASGPPEVVHGVDDLTMPVGTRDAVVPRAYVLPADMADIVAKLRAHNIKVQALEAPRRLEGEEFRIDKMRKVRSGGYEMTVLDGTFAPLATKEFPAGSFYLDMAQPMANAAFYYLEPQARDGFVGWSVLDDKLRAIGADKGARDLSDLQGATRSEVAG